MNMDEKTIKDALRKVKHRVSIHVQMADELLLYTNLSRANIYKRAGLGSANNLYLAYKCEFDIALSERFLKIRKEGDVGRLCG